ncbi:enoyl-CoA hydratase/isomerase family protein [Wenxinia saemankumensis]|uniref:Enoyl-CoA hydratase/carnithine racemase n=1 Tax=Wenxinia saemankumensis TaxID=1447782 RepID=A0A1M6E3L0_9RHOB|nr:enoyl-CoA hydratase/isomerase family protein [Wenxinia saemankumensis]SHI79973.1 Enoyl-CoA hydratase/carnithine racemase [Wenxinia saemankumensis]
MSGHVAVTDEAGGALRLVVLDRPDKANALTGDMLEALCAAIGDYRGRALILSGRGRVFSAGADLCAVRQGLGASPLWERLSGAVAAFPGLSIAALNGPVAGGACGMALACDLRVAAPTAALFYPVMRMGLTPPPSDPARLAALVGPARARAILLAGHRVEGAALESWGLAQAMAADPLAAARAWAAPALAAPEGLTARIAALIP